MNDFHQQFASKASFVDRVRQAVGERDHSGDFCHTVRAAVEGPRQQDYGHPFDNHTRTAKFWSVYLGKDLLPEGSILRRGVL